VVDQALPARVKGRDRGWPRGGQGRGAGSMKRVVFWAARGARGVEGVVLWAPAVHQALLHRLEVVLVALTSTEDEQLAGGVGGVEVEPP